SFCFLCFLCFCMIWASCHKPPIIAELKTPCAVQAVIIDMRNLDGCKYLLQLTDGTKLLPLNWPATFPQEDGLKIWITYDIVKDGASMCMAEDQMVTLQCVQKRESSDGAFLRDCPKVIDPMRVDWMKEVIIERDPNRIDRYQYLEGFAYMFYCNTSKCLYDCAGRLICTRTEDDKGCQDIFSEIKNQTVIWVLNN
ncbi:MAG: hypothetical protein ABIV51_14490, partial [Saprospiraceae bacterium]